MKITMRTLTPLWTGGVDAGKVDRLHETGVLGGLRWWMEVLVRGLGGQVNDPTQKERSGFDHKTYNESRAVDERARLRDAGLCDVSQVFGATGWRRRFRLDIQDKTIPDQTITSQIQAQRSYADRNGKTHTPTWRFPDKPRAGQFDIRIRRMSQDFRPETMGGLIQFVADWAALGARAQMGFGVVEPVNGRVETRTLYDWLIASAGSQVYPSLPSLQNIFLAKIKSKEMGHPFADQTSFNLKYDLRRLFAGDQQLRHFIMGTIKDGRMASKVKISRPYGDGVIRVWGWIPEELGAYTGRWDRNTIVDDINRHLKTNYTLLVWREMNSPRDSHAPDTGDAILFLRSLLGLEGDGNGT